MSTTMYMGGIPSLSETTILLISKQAREKVKKNLLVHHLNSDLHIPKSCADEGRQACGWFSSPWSVQQQMKWEGWAKPAQIPIGQIYKCCANVNFWFVSPLSCLEDCRWRLIPQLLSCWAIEKKKGKARTQSKENTVEGGKCNETCWFSSVRQTNGSSWRKLLMHKKEIDEVPEVQAQK